MNTVKMNKFGQTLTDRADGKKAADEILRKFTLPVQLDFEGVVAMGSSFGDEVVLSIAAKQGDTIDVLNANRVIRNSLMRIIENTAVAISFSP